MELRILFIENDHIDQSLGDSSLMPFFKGGFENTMLALSLAEADELLKQSINNATFPHIILCEMQLFEGTGFDFLDIFEQKYLVDYPKTVIGLITAIATPNDWGKFKNYPFAFDIFIRPVNYKYEIIVEEAVKRFS